MFIEADEWDDLEIAIFPNLDEELIRESLGGRAADFALTLTLRDPMLKRRKRVESWPCDGPLPTRIEIDRSDVSAIGHHRSLDLTLMLCMSVDRPVEAGWPSLQGSWLSRKKFSLKSPRQKATFDIQPLNDDIRRGNDLPAGTLVFAEVTGSLNEPLEEGESFATVYLAEDVYAAVNSPRSTHELSAIIEAEMILALIGAISDDLDTVDAVLERSPLFSLLSALGGKNPMTLKEFKRHAGKPQALRARVHDEIGIVDQLRNL